MAFSKTECAASSNRFLFFFDRALLIGTLQEIARQARAKRSEASAESYIGNKQEAGCERHTACILDFQLDGDM